MVIFLWLRFHPTEKTAGLEPNLKLIWPGIFAILGSLSDYPASKEIDFKIPPPPLLKGE
jgi:hypothetical protein